MTGNNLSPTSPYQEFLAEREEILRHKWLQSEIAGRDVGFDAALVDWTVNHRPTWLKKRSAKLKSLGQST